MGNQLFFLKKELRKNENESVGQDAFSYMDVIDANNIFFIGGISRKGGGDVKNASCDW